MPRNRLLAALSIVLLLAGTARAGELRLEDLIGEALANNSEVLASRARWSASSYRPPQESSLPDPMVMFGYQNEGWERYTYGEMPDAQWMFSLSQTVPYPGKRSLKGERAWKESQGLEAMHEASRLRTVAEVRERYYDLFLVHKSLDLVEEKRALFLRVEEAAMGRYSAGRAPQQEVLMAQTEKYMLDERVEMLRQRREAQEAMLNAALGREDIGAPLGRPAEPAPGALDMTLEETILRAYEDSPEVKARRRMAEAARVGVESARKEYYPDFTVTGSYFARGGAFDDMWSLTMAVNIPIFYKTKQRNAERESAESAREAEHELEASRKALAAALRDNYSMAASASRLMSLYRDSLIPRARQNFESAVSGYSAGKADLALVVRSLTALLDNELQYWGQFAEREKAIARMDALRGARQYAGGGTK
ncbi:MAG: hypothetical protein Kow0025_15480 [Thermodesulfovibrionales bacterium]